MGLPRLSAYVLAALVVLEVVAVAVLVGVADQPVIRVAVASVLSLFSAAVGVVVARRRPTNWVGTLLVLVALVPINQAFDDMYAGVVQTHPGLLPVWDVYLGLSPGTWMWLFVPPALLILVFPDGRLPGRRTQ
jgi:hypothetical protein